MTREDENRIVRVGELCRQAADELGTAGSFRLRVLLQMLLAEVKKGASAAPGAHADGKSRRA